MARIEDIIKSVGSDLRKAQNSMFSRKYIEAQDLLTRIDALLEEGRSMDADHMQLKTLSNQAAKLAKDIDQKIGSASPKTQPQSPQTGTGVVKLPAGVEKRIRDMNQLISRGKSDDAISVFMEIDVQYAGQFDVNHPDYHEKALWVEETKRKKLADSQTEKGNRELQEKERQERMRQSSEWENRLRELPLLANWISNQEEWISQQQLFAETKRIFQEYQSVSFSHGKEDGLEQIEKKVGERIADFPQMLAAVRSRALNEINEHLNSRLEALGRMMEGKPSIMSDSSVAESRRFIDERKWSFEPDEDAVIQMDDLFRNLLEKNEKNKKERAELILIQDDCYSGSDAGGIKEKIENYARMAAGAGDILRTVIYKPEWKEISQWEDYAGNQRFVTRGEIYGQSALRVNGKIFLFTVYITKERKSDGVWSGLQGNVMYQEEMAEKNLDRSS